MYKTGHAFTYLLLKESAANDVINVLLFAYAVRLMHGRPLLGDHSMDWTPLLVIASENPPHHACSISCLEIP